MTTYVEGMPHIVIDTAGMRPYARVTCTIDGATLLEKPYWGQEDWDEALEHFLENHSDPGVCEHTAELEKEEYYD